MKSPAPLLAFCAAISALGAGKAAAQIVTDGTMGPSGPVTANGNVYAIPENLGQAVGGNLFHSFSEFDVPAGWEADFTGDASIANVIARVTGGDASLIAGDIKVEGPSSANFFLINPAGIVVTNGASFDIPGGLYLSTANQLHFADGASLPIAAVTPTGALTVAAPESFGFVGPQAAITLNSVTATFNHDVVVAGGNVNIADSTLTVNAALRLTAIGDDGGQVALTGASDPAFTGALAINGSTLQSTDRGSSAFLDAGQLNVENARLSFVGDLDAVGHDVLLSGGSVISAAHIEADALAISDRSVINAQSNGLSISAANNIRLTGGAIIRGDTTGDVAIAADTVAIDGGAGITINNSRSGRASGQMTIEANHVLLDDGAITSTGSGAAASNAGNIVIAADTELVLRNGSRLSSSALTAGATGNAGDVTVRAPHVTIDHSTLEARAQNGGSGGAINIDADSLAMFGATVSTEASGSGGSSISRAGNINVANAAHDISIGLVDSTISAKADAGGDAGDIVVQGSNMSLVGSSIDSSTTGTARGSGAINITLSGLLGLDGGSIVSTSDGGAAAGAISIDAGGLVTMANGARISSATTTSPTTSVGGDAGNITIAASRLALDQSAIDSSTGTVDGVTGTAGAAGNVSITVHGDGALTMANASTISATSGHNAQSRRANATTLTVDAGAIAIDNSTIRTGTTGRRDSAPITITSRHGLTMADGSLIEAESADGAQGAAGNIRIDVTGDVSLDHSAISNATATPATMQAVNRAGAIELDVHDGSVILANYASIKTTISSLSAAPAGSIAITADRLLMSDNSGIDGRALSGAAAAANIAIDVDAIAMSANSSINSRTNASTGAGGRIEIGAHEFSMAGGSAITASSIGAGAGLPGNVTLGSPDDAMNSMSITGGSNIETSSDNGVAGSISFYAHHVVLESGHVSSDNSSAGNAGAINILSVSSLNLSEGAYVRTNSLSGEAGDIQFLMPDGGLLTMQNGAISTNSTLESGGEIHISDPVAIVSNGASITALGVTHGSNVQIHSDYWIQSFDHPNLVSVDGTLVLDTSIQDVSRGTLTTDVAFLDASRVLRGQCAAEQASGQTSQLATVATGPHAGGAPIGLLALNADALTCRR